MVARRVLTGEEYRLVVRGKINGADTWENVYQFHVYGQTALGCNESDVADRFWTLNGTNYLAVMSEHVTADFIDIQRVNADGKANRPFITKTLSAAAGAVTGDAMPNIIAGILSFQTALVGPRYRGRVYLPPTGESHNGATGQPNTTWFNLAATLEIGLATPMTATSGGGTSDLEPVVRSRAHASYEVITNAFPRTEWGRQVRRTRGRGI